MLRSRAPSMQSSKRFKSSTKSTAVAKRSSSTSYKMYSPNPRYYVSLGKQFLPKMLKQTLRYFEGPSIAITAGVGGRYQFSCNGLYDPNVTGTGHQPMGFDQMAALYNHYTVVSSRFKLTPCMDNGTALVVCAWIDDDTTTSASITENAERPSAKLMYTNPSNGWATVPSLYLSWSAKEAFGSGTLSDPSMQGSSSANPTEQQYFTFTAFDPLSGTDATNFFMVELEYDVIWDELTTLAGS